MADYTVLTPVNILTGFLGSGKTTLLQRLLTSPQLADVAVLVNELGEIGLDHHLLQNVAESTLLLENGCVCCAIRGDLQQALRDLLSKRMRGDISNFRRVVIETSGLADPVPIAYTLLREPVICHHYRLSTILTTVDAVNGMAQLETFAEASKQAAVADRLILTKTDLVDADSVNTLAAHLRRLNPSALLLGSAELDADSGRLLIDDIYDADGKPREIVRWLAADDQGGAIRPLRCWRTTTPTTFIPLASPLSSRSTGRPSVSGQPCCCIGTGATYCGSRRCSTSPGFRRRCSSTVSSTLCTRRATLMPGPTATGARVWFSSYEGSLGRKSSARLRRSPHWSIHSIWLRRERRSQRILGGARRGVQPERKARTTWCSR